INLALHNPDLTTARRVAEAINAFIGEPSARAIDPTTISLNIPMTHAGNMVGLLTDIEQLRVEPDQLARVVIDETSGTIVIGQEVRIDAVAIAQGNLTVTVTQSQQVSQPLPFSTTGTTQVVDRTNIQIDEGQDNKLAVLNTGVTLQALVNGLNSLGIGPRDMITILQTIKAAGALQARIEVL
ncbi:MAG: flagellar basal body P-ring protein FlgI, partial [Rhodospirillaceae bacterium]|nr:flagellar basal body P-ring protein FlgI [Rhodospirillaceae bacterium]